MRGRSPSCEAEGRAITETTAADHRENASTLVHGWNCEGEARAIEKRTARDRRESASALANGLARAGEARAVRCSRKNSTFPFMFFANLTNGHVKFAASMDEFVKFNLRVPLYL